MQHLSHVIFYVDDVVKSVEFFEKAFGLVRDFIDDTQVYAQIKTGATALAFAKKGFITSNIADEFTWFSADQNPGMQISFSSSNVKMAYQQALENGCKEVAYLQEKPWGQTVGYVKTPDGILVELASVME